MKDPKRFYTYAYLRENKTPYYIGKGEGIRPYKNHGKIPIPKDRSRIIFLKQNLTEKEAFKHEIYMISVLGRKDLGTGILRNMTDGGDGTSGAIVSNETRRKMSEKRKGKTHSEETKRKQSEAHKGKKLSGETRKKLSEAHIGHLPSEETKRKQSEVKKGKNNPFYGKSHSEETKRKQGEVRIGKYGGENHYFYGKSHSEETKRKQSEVKKGKNNPNYGKKWWNDGCGNYKKSLECPGDGWVLGRKLKQTT